MPVIIPFFSGANHLIAGGVVDTFEAPMPIPDIIQNVKIMVRGSTIKPERMSPKPIRILAIVAVNLGPLTS